MAGRGVTFLPALAAAALAPLNAYLLAMLGAAAWGRRRRAPAWTTTGGLRLAVVVPARDEEAGVGETLASLYKLEYPPERVEMIVIADNCSDRTAEVAASAGATVWVRQGAAHGGKGGALAWGLERLANERPEVDAVVLVDADCTVAPNLLSAVEARLCAGASAVQAVYEVSNPDDSFAAGLRYASFSLINNVRPLGKATLGLSSGLFGTGMAFSRALLARRPWTARSLLEDQEYHLELVAAGERVAFASETWVRSAMPTSLRRSSGQQLRWDAGRGRLIRRWTPRLLALGLRRRDPARMHAAFEPLVPPQSLLLAANLAGAAMALRASRRIRGVAFANLAGQAGFVAGGLALTRAPAGVWRALAFAPAQALWKLGVLGRLWLGRGPTSWVRTSRETALDQPLATGSGRVGRPDTRRTRRRSCSRRT
jgi:1,2-diacylglycerol 3-beta-glucosyltransferase